jgi:SWI/SNF chromatin-remodeling complex subunit SWI1
MDSGRGGPALRDSPASPFTTLDPSIAKQMAAISQYSHARSALSGNTNILPPRPIANGALSGTTANNSGFSGQMTSPNDSISSNQAQHSQDDMQSANERKMRTWYNSIVQFMASRGTPLPPTLTGVPWPQGYDPTTSPFKGIEAGAEPYSFRLAGKDVNLFRFWTTIMSAGGASKASAVCHPSVITI